MIADLQLKKSQAAEQVNGRPSEAVYRDSLATAKSAFDARDYDAAKKAFDTAARVKPLPPDMKAMYDTASQQVGKLEGAKALFNSQRYQEALACFDNAVSLRPDSVEALSNRAIACLELQRFDEALAAFAAVFAIDPEHAISWSNRGNVLVAMRRFEDSVASYDRALSIRPDFPEARDNRKYALGMIYFEKGQFDRAQYVLDEAVRLNPLLLDGLCIRGIALLRLKRHVEALACFERALAAKPDFVEALSNRATAYLELNRIEEALAGFNAALAVDSNHASGWRNML